MVLVQVFGQLMQIVNGPGTTAEGNFTLRSAPPWAGATSAEELAAALSGPQVRALTEMASWAETNLQGETGTTGFRGRTIPNAAMAMREQFGGSDFGGMSTQELRERRKAQRVDINDLSRAAGAR